MARRARLYEAWEQCLKDIYATMPLPAGTAFGSIGQPIRRKEDARLLTGKGRFTDDFTARGPDLRRDGALAVSACAHRRASTPRAPRRCRACSRVFTGADCTADGLKPIPHDPVPATKFDMKLTRPAAARVFVGPHMLLPADKARHVGEAVAMVVAETSAQAMDAAEAVEVEYEELPFVIHSEDALKPGAPVVWDEIPDNVPCDTMFGDKAATDRAFAQAAHVVKAKFNIVRVTGVPMELRSASPSSTRRPANTRSTPAPAARCARRSSSPACSALRPTSCASCPMTSAAISAPATGRSSSSAWCCGPRGKLKRPVKYTATRSEAFLTDYQGRDLVTKVELAFDKGGRFLAMRADNISNAGARCVSLSPLSKGSGLITGSYDIPAATLRARAVFTNTMPTNAYRSVRPAGGDVRDRAADGHGGRRSSASTASRCAARIWSSRRRCRTATPSACSTTAAPTRPTWTSRWRSPTGDGFKQRKREAKKRGRLLGLGLAQLRRILDRRAARSAPRSRCSPTAASTW